MTITVKFIPNDKGNPQGKLTDAELHFSADGMGEDGDPIILDGLKLVGFAVWQTRTGKRVVTFPARTYSINGERRSFALLRPIDGSTAAQDPLAALILDAYAKHERDLADCDGTLDQNEARLAGKL